MRELTFTVLFLPGVYFGLMGFGTKNIGICACGVALVAVAIVGLVRNVGPRRRH